MKRGMSDLFFFLLVVSSLMLFRCALPDPTDPSKTKMTVVFKNTDYVVFGNTIVDTVGKPIKIGAALYLPENFDSISLVIKEHDTVTVDTMFRIFNTEYFNDTVWYTKVFSSEGNKTVTLTPFSTPSLQPLVTNIPIVARPIVSVVHITFLNNHISATGTMPVQTCASGKTDLLPANAFINPGYRFSGWAITATGSVKYKDKDEITLGAEDLVLFAIWEDQNSATSPVIAHVPPQLIAGKADTLLFAVDNSSRTDSLTISYVTKSPLDPSVFSIVPTGPDTIKIAIAQSAQSASANIGIVTSNGTKSDTSWYPVTFISSETALWKITSKDLDATEGLPVQLDLSQYLSAASSTGISLSADSGIISGTTWSYTPAWGCAVKIPVIITAEKGDVSLALNINLNVASGDTAKPRLNLVDPSLDGKKVSSSQITVECKATDEGAGIDSVVFSYGTKKIRGILQGDDIYSGVITGLVHNTPTQITVTATDKSRQKNNTTITFTVSRDSTLLDDEQPAIVKISGPESGSRIQDAKGSLTFTVNDNVGVDSVWWTLNDAFVAVVPTSGESKYTISYTLSDYGKNVIKVFAKDKSAAGNKGSQTVTLNYNTEPAAVTLTAPAADATDVSTSPTFKWSGGEDADGDGVTFIVNYGTSQTSLSNTATVTGKTAVLSSPLAYAETFYWRVTAASSSTAYPDKIQSSVGTFTTEGSLPSITGHPQSQSIEAGQSVTFSVTAGGFGTLSYLWRLNQENIVGATSSSYKISSVITSMNNNSYDCVVKNEVGEVISNAAKLTVTEIPTFTVSFVTDGGTPKPDPQTITRGGLVTKPSADPVRSGYRFTGWYELNATHEFYFTTAAITADLTIYAGWKKVYTVTYNKNTGESGSVPTGPAVYDSGTVVTIAGNTGNLTKAGYEFKGWTTTPNGSGSALTTVSVQSDINLYPKWVQLKYTIEFVDNDCGNETQTYTVDAGTFFTNCPSLTDPSGAKIFNGWSENVCNTYINGHKTVYAQWKANTITIYWHCIDPRVKKSETIEYGATSIPSAFTTQEMQDYYSSNRGIWPYENCNYAGWFEDAECLNYFYYDGLPITKNINLYAKTLGCGQE